MSIRRVCALFFGSVNRGALVVVGPWAGLSGRDILSILAMTFFGGLAVNRLAFRLGIKDSPW